MNKYEKGMIAGAKPFGEISEENAEIIENMVNELGEPLHELKVKFNRIVDIIAEEDPLHKAEIIELLKEEKDKNLKPANYAIHLVHYSNEWKEIADEVRKALNKSGNTASLKSYGDYKYNNKKADYYILMGHDTNEGEAKVLLYANGCKISKIANTLYVYCDELIGENMTDEVWEEFVNYYKDVTNFELDLNKEMNEAHNARKEKREAVDVVDKVGNKLIDFLFKPANLLLDINIPEPLMILTLPAGIIASVIGLLLSVVTLPLGVTAKLVTEVINGLDERDQKFIKKAQRQIIELKLCEYIRNMQLSNLE